MRDGHSWREWACRPWNPPPRLSKSGDSHHSVIR
jgi:hypothetical protein